MARIALHVYPEAFAADGAALVDDDGACVAASYL